MTASRAAHVTVGEFRLDVAADGQLRWHRGEQVVTLRHVVGTLERYEPVRSLTRAAVNRRGARNVGHLRMELRRLLESPIVLNIALRAAVLASPRSLSDIAWSCQRHQKGGSLVGDSSWLQRRIGMMTEHGVAAPTPWVSSDVLALIARDGLGIAPRDVEVDLEDWPVAA